MEEENTKEQPVEAPTKKLKKLKKKVEGLELKADLKVRENNALVDIETCKHRGIKNTLAQMKADTISYFNWVRDNQIRLAKAVRGFEQMENNEYLDLVDQEQPIQSDNKGFDILEACELPRGIILNF